MTNSTVKTGQYTVAIEDLEELGWDFSIIYDEGANALGISLEENVDLVNEKYNIVIIINDNGSTEFRLDAGCEFSNNEPTGDDELTRQDIQYLIEEKKTIKFKEN